MSRSSLPTFSISWSVPALRSSSNFLSPDLFSSMNSLANSPDWISARISFIAAREASPITRLPRVRSPYSAVLEIEYSIPRIPFSYIRSAISFSSWRHSK